jgi:hypothetical protein
MRFLGYFDYLVLLKLRNCFIEILDFALKFGMLLGLMVHLLNLTMMKLELKLFA